MSKPLFGFYYLFLLCFSNEITPSFPLFIPKRFSASIVSISLSFSPLATNALDLIEPKQLNLPAQQISKIVSEDITKRQALATASFTRSIYSEKCTFTDEIDTYDLPSYVKGTSALFDSMKSHVDLVGDVEADDNLISFKFKETLAFNIPFKPKVALSGKVELKRAPRGSSEGGLIISSREFWDQSVGEVLKTVSF